MRLARLMRRDARKSARVAVSLTSKLRTSPLESMAVEVENISPYGLRASGPLAVRRGDWVSIELPVLGPTTAKVAWADGDRFGAVFRAKIDMAPFLETARGLVSRSGGAMMSGTSHPRTNRGSRFDH